jgi:hypothetical protein
MIAILLYDEEDVWEYVWGHALPAATRERGFGALCNAAPCLPGEKFREKETP